MEANEKRTGTKNLFIGAIIALLLVNTYTFFSYLSEKTSKENIGSEMVLLEHEFNHLSWAFENTNSELELMKADHLKTNELLEQKQAEVMAQKKQIESLLAKNKLSQGELSKAKSLLTGYEKSINDLNAQLQLLALENGKLLHENQNLFTALNSEKQVNTQLSEQNKHLADKVAIGSLLSLDKLDVEAVKTSVFGREVTAKKAKAAEGLRISFETGENKILDPGTLSLYVRIINPKGETISVADAGSSLINTANGAEPVMITRQADIDWTKTNKRVLIYWTQHINDPGIYKVEIYQNGHVIGEREVKLS